MPTMAITLKNPFHAKNNGINFLAVYVDGRQVPAKPLQPNFETGHYVRSYVNLFSATGKQAQDEGNELTRDDFGNGYTFFGFDLTPDACDGGCFHLVRKGNLRIEIHFATPWSPMIDYPTSSAPTRLLSCATPMTAINRENIGSPCT